MPFALCALPADSGLNGLNGLKGLGECVRWFSLENLRHSRFAIS
jgi:hypothetical protein